MESRLKRISRKAITLMLAAVLVLTTLPLLSVPAFTASAASVSASGKVSASGVNLRASANTSSRVVATLKKNKKLTIHKEVFTKNKSTKKINRWYYVSAGKKEGYIRSDLVRDINWSKTAAVTTDALNYRTGPSTSYKVLGTTGVGAPVTLLLPAGLSGSGQQWYKASVNGKTAYVIADYIKLGTSLFIKKSPSAKGKGV